MSEDTLVRCMDYLHFKDLAMLRMVNKTIRNYVVGDNFWDRVSVIQEERNNIGKHVVLYKQFLMSKEQASALPESALYK